MKVNSWADFSLHVFMEPGVANRYSLQVIKMFLMYTASFILTVDLLDYPPNTLNNYSTLAVFHYLCWSQASRCQI